VLIIGDYPQTLAAVRSLARGGYRVIVGRGTRPSVAERSKYCSEVWQCPDLMGKTFAEQLSRFIAERDDIRCILPVGEPNIAQLHAAAPILPREVAIASVPAEHFAACVDKMTTNAWAQEAGIDVPDSRIVYTHDELITATRSLGFPLIVKSLRTERRVLDRKAFIVRDAEEFANYFATWPQGMEQLLVQRYVEGSFLSCDFVAQAGKVVAYAQSDICRTDMPDGTGFGVEFRSKAADPDLFNALKSFVSTHGYCGPGLIQCIRCNTSGRVYFVEVNPRMSAGVAEVCAVGIDIPLISVRSAAGAAYPEICSVEALDQNIGTRVYWLERDALALMTQYRHLSATEVIRWLAHMVRTAATCDAHINWRWTDPLPSLTILYRLLRSRTAGLLKTLLGRTTPRRPLGTR
jgi:predicted ATP-grasp superfamily ATP-dependent carboligase